MSYKERYASKRNLKPSVSPERRRVTTIPTSPCTSAKKQPEENLRGRKQRSYTLPAVEESILESIDLKQRLEYSFETPQPIPPQLIEEKEVSLPRRVGYEGKKTLIFDLDETLVHCVQDLDNNPEVFLNVKLPNGKLKQTGFNIRPFLKESLAELSLLFETVLFTASRKFYADAILDYLDPTNTLFHHRLYRQHCINFQGNLIKDLRIFKGRKISDLIIVDNMPASFANQINNGIAISPWFNDYSDTELCKLREYLKIVAYLPDVRNANKRAFQLQNKRKTGRKISAYIPKHLAF